MWFGLLYYLQSARFAAWHSPSTTAPNPPRPMSFFLSSIPYLYLEGDGRFWSCSSWCSMQWNRSYIKRPVGQNQQGIGECNVTCSWPCFRLAAFFSFWQVIGWLIRQSFPLDNGTSITFKQWCCVTDQGPTNFRSVNLSGFLQYFDPLQLRWTTKTMSSSSLFLQTSGNFLELKIVEDFYFQLKLTLIQMG